ncbi:ATP-binding protein [Terrabacter lapilli]|uniref:Nuclease SbcCD subunit C n=1 Tax=Terrabacter lapilli TaxID=436231 RepID=A0ABN2S4E6_9MICO
MTHNLVQWVADRIDADATLTEEVGLIILAALEGDAALADQLAGTSTERPQLSQDESRESPDGPVPAGVFLKSVEVEGFRGVGSTSTVRLSPQPGLTIIAGRNGSGKSSLAEALEVALTGSTYRWKNKSLQWKEHWRNLHHSGDSRIVVQVVEEGRGESAIGCSWPEGVTDVNEPLAWVQRPGSKRVPGTAVLGWSAALETFRPMMSYDELGGMLEAAPSALYDALSRALGVEQISDAIRRLEVQHKALKAPGDALAATRKSLYTDASAVDDERAVSVATLLKKTQPDVAALRGLATGLLVSEDGPLRQLRTLEGLRAPAEAEVQNAAGALKRAVAGMARAGEAELARDAARLDVRRQALRVHEQFGDMTCPVCAGTHLDHAWAEAARDDIQRRSRHLAELQLARDDLERARMAARRLLMPRPACLDREPVSELSTIVTDARHAWDAWAAAPSGDLELAEHLELYWQDLDAAVAGLRAASAEQLQSRHDVWAPIATRVVAFCDTYGDWMARKATVDDLASAVKWLKANDTRLKNERLIPISDAARSAWALLRQESNVDLGALTLEGTATRRRVSIESTVDGQHAGALAVMSQGELHALALALFLPRASLPESPFRFVVLDDPVQAMDPAKVEGLVQLLAELAKSRQVIVLSHDDRLPAAARRARVGARVLEVSRGTHSTVTISTSIDPAQRYLRDAFALTRDEGLPEESLRHTLPGMLRFAIEAAARDALFERRLARGDALADVEEVWSSAHATRQRVSLALYDEVRSLDAWLVRSYRRFGMGVATSGMHEGLRNAADGISACRAVEDLVKDLRAGNKQ